jgi:hypothetical protein
MKKGRGQIAGGGASRGFRKQTSDRSGEPLRHPKSTAAGEGARSTRALSIFRGFNGALKPGPSQDHLPKII